MIQTKNLNPMKKNEHLQNFIKEEVDNFFNKKQLKMDNGIKTFLQGRYTMTKKYIKRCSTSLIIWGMEPKPQ